MDVVQEDSTSIFDELDNSDTYKDFENMEVILPTDFIFNLIHIAIENGNLSFNECLNELEFFSFLDFMEWLTRRKKEEESDGN